MELLVVNRLSEEDAKCVMEMRNDPVTLGASFNKTPEVWPNFFEKFKKDYFVEESLPCLFGIVHGQRVGFLRFAPYALPPFTGMADMTCNISIMVAPEQRRKGRGAELVTAGTNFVHTNGWKTVMAEVFPDNPASVNMFLKCGYTEIEGRSYRPPTATSDILMCRFIHQRLQSEQ